MTATIRSLDRPGDLGWVIKAHGEVYAAEFIVVPAPRLYTVLCSMNGRIAYTHPPGWPRPERDGSPTQNQPHPADGNPP